MMAVETDAKFMTARHYQPCDVCSDPIVPGETIVRRTQHIEGEPHSEVVHESCHHDTAG